MMPKAPRLSCKVGSYLAWEAAPTATKAGESGGTLVNTYQIQEGANGVDIRLTSIHSKNSKTHAATLILETFRNSHFIQKLMLCLEGKEAAAKRPLESTKKDMMLICGGYSTSAYALPCCPP